MINDYYHDLLEVTNHSGLQGTFMRLGESDILEYSSNRFELIVASEATIDSIIMAELKVDLLMADVDVCYLNELAELGLALIAHDSDWI